MGKPTGFLEVAREKQPARPVAERLRDWREVYLPYDEAALRGQASRCMDCGIPFCHQGCPLGNLIPSWNDLVFTKRWRAAIERLHETNTFRASPAGLGPPRGGGAGGLGITAARGRIRGPEAGMVDGGSEGGWTGARPPHGGGGRQGAVAGSGPAGLAAADQINR